MLQKLPTISVQRLFALAVALKIGFSFAGYLVGDPLWLGMAAPMTVMVLYMFIGYYKREEDVSEEKFADSCYYIGFIFTIVSIILCLIDVPNLSPGQGLYEISMRFGAAMISTVLGMIVRVYLVSFKKDVTDAVKDVEATLIEATRAFTLQMEDTVKRLQMFEAQVTDATKASVAGAQLQVEALGRNFSESLGKFYEQVNEENRSAFQEMLKEVRGSTAQLAVSVQTYSGGMKGHLQSIEDKVTQFADAITARLQKTTFPDDFFAKQLQAPLDQLKLDAASLGESVRGVSAQVIESSTTISSTLKTIDTKTKKAQDAMSAVVDLAEQQRILLNSSDLQLNTLVQLSQRLESLDAALKGILQTIGTNTTASAVLMNAVSNLSSNSNTLRSDIKDTITALTNRLDANATLANGAIERLETKAAELSAGASNVISSLEQSTNSAERIAQQMSASVIELKTISNATVQATTGVHEAAKGAADGAAQVVQSVRELDSSIRQHTGGLIEAAQKLGQSNEAQPSAIASAIVKSLSTTVTSLFPHGPRIDGHGETSLVPGQAPST